MSRLKLSVCALAVAMAAAGCQPSTGPQNGAAPASNANAGRSNAGAAPQSNQRAGVGASASDAGQPVTLAVLDAFFAEESFAGELKTRLQLTDEQVERLKRAAGEERAGLGEDGGGEREGAAREAEDRAERKVGEVVGPDKVAQLFAFVREKWSGGEAGGAQAAATPAKPNAVPADTRIVVNIPAYRMDAFEGGRLVKSYKVGIGYPEFPLPTGMRKADTIIFNPTWTPPDEPWVKGQFKPGQKVEAGSKANPLGLIKIPIGAPSLIHGGKSPARIGSFASHGCVGLTNPQVQEFAVVLAGLGGAQVDKAQVDTFAQTRAQTRNVRLANPVPVEIRYETIVVEDGKLYIYRDIYDRGTNTEENLRRVLEASGLRLEDLSPEERARVTTALREMARDAYGNPATGAGATPTPTPRRRGGGPVRETKTIKGKKEVVIELAALKGKGYPAPVALNTGGAPQPKPPAPKPAARQTAGR